MLDTLLFMKYMAAHLSRDIHIVVYKQDVYKDLYSQMVENPI